MLLTGSLSFTSPPNQTRHPLLLILLPKYFSSQSPPHHPCYHYPSISPLGCCLQPPGWSPCVLGFCCHCKRLLYHKFSGLNQNRCILLLIWRSEVHSGSDLGKVKVLAGVVPSGGSRGESVSLPFLLVATYVSCFVGSSSVFKAYYSILCFHRYIPFSQ